MRTLFSTLLAAAVLVGATSPAPLAAQSCTQSYYLCLNDNVYPESGLKKELEALECGFEYVGCMTRKL